VATTDLRVVKDENLERILNLGPNFRRAVAKGPVAKNGSSPWRDYVSEQLKPFQRMLHERFGVDDEEAGGLRCRIAERMDRAINIAVTTKAELEETENPTKCEGYWKINAGNPSSPFVVTAMDKFQDRFAVCCRKCYYKTCFEHLDDGSSYELYAQETEDEIVDRILAYTDGENLAHWFAKKQKEEPEKPKCVPYLYFSLKLHKPKTGMRFISGGKSVVTTPTSKIVSAALRECYEVFDKVWCQMWVTNTGISCVHSPILKTTDELLFFWRKR